MTQDSRFALWLIMAIALTFSAACQGGGTHRPVDTKVKGDPEWWLDALRVEQDRYVDTVFRKCPTQGFLGNKKCVNATALESFAEQGGAAAACETEDALGALLLCMELISASERAIAPSAPIRKASRAGMTPMTRSPRFRNWSGRA